MRKFLTKKFWSHGTPLGYLGAGSQADLSLGPCRFQILIIWGPYDFPVLVALQAQAENLKPIRSRCENKSRVVYRLNFVSICILNTQFLQF